MAEKELEKDKKDPKETTETPESKAYVDERVDDFLGKEPETDVEDKAKEIEEKPTAPPTEEEPPLEEPKETPPEIDTAALKEAVRKEVTEDIAKRLVGERKPEEELSPWEKEGRNPKDYNEIADYVADLTQKRLTAQQAETKKEQEAQAIQQKEQQQKTTDEWNTYWDGQLDDLRTQGKLPRVGDKENKDDVGVVAQREIFSQMFQLNVQRNNEGLAPITNIKEFFYEHYKNPTDQPPGADAPVSGGKTSVDEGKNKDEYSYEDIHHARDFESLIGSKE